MWFGFQVLPLVNPLQPQVRLGCIVIPGKAGRCERELLYVRSFCYHILFPALLCVFSVAPETTEAVVTSG